MGSIQVVGAVFSNDSTVAGHSKHEETKQLLMYGKDFCARLKVRNSAFLIGLVRKISQLLNCRSLIAQVCLFNQVNVYTTQVIVIYVSMHETSLGLTIVCLKPQIKFILKYELYKLISIIP